MHVEHLSLHDFRSYADAELPLGPGVTTLLGDNGQGKTNAVEALGYLAALGSHRVAADAALVRAGTERAVVRARLRRGERTATAEIEIVPGRANRARVNGSPLGRPRELLGLLRCVVFAPEDLAIVKAEPDVRRRFLDDLVTVRQPRLAAVRADYERVVRQRGALLKTARAAGGRARAAALASLDAWDSQLAELGADLLAGRLAALAALTVPAVAAYGAVSGVPDAMTLRYRARGLVPPGTAGAGAGAGGGAGGAGTGGRRDGTGETGEDSPEHDVTRVAGDLSQPDRAALREALLAAAAAARAVEVERGSCLVGPQRDDLDIAVNDLPVRGYASHGESWSAALALRLGTYDLLRAEGGDGGEPVLVLDDVFAELDATRRRHLAERAGTAEQAVVTAAVAEDVPPSLAGRTLLVSRDATSGLSRVVAP